MADIGGKIIRGKPPSLKSYFFEKLTKGKNVEIKLQTLIIENKKLILCCHLVFGSSESDPEGTEACADSTSIFCFPVVTFGLLLTEGRIVLPILNLE